MSKQNFLLPNINDGRFFVSPILGCTGACCYCYLDIKNYSTPRKNELKEAELLLSAKNSKDFIFGKKGTIVSIGAWGDVFPLGNDELIRHSIDVITFLLSWGNPIQIMSKNRLDSEYIERIACATRYPDQLLYSTTITTIEKWDYIEPGTSSPFERLEVCREFHKRGICTNVLLKPFLPGLTDLEIGKISNLLSEYQIDFCTLGVWYWNSEIEEKVLNNEILKNVGLQEKFLNLNHLDCDGDKAILSTSIENLVPYIKYLREKKIKAFLKSSCVNSNVLSVKNPSNYFLENSPYCINCGNCKR